MSDIEILCKLIKIVKKNGCNIGDPFKHGELSACRYEDVESALYGDHDSPPYYKQIIFSHEFAKAFWGENKIDVYVHSKGEYMIIYKVEWKYHLQQMVLEENPLKYLERFLEK